MAYYKICPLLNKECNKDCAWRDYDHECRAIKALERFSEILEIRKQVRGKREKD